MDDEDVDRVLLKKVAKSEAKFSWISVNHDETINGTGSGTNQQKRHEEGSFVAWAVNETCLITERTGWTWATWAPQNDWEETCGGVIQIDGVIN